MIWLEVPLEKKCSDQRLQTVENKAAVSQRRLAPRFALIQSWYLKKRTSVRKDQQQQAKSNCRKICQLIIDDENYLTVSADVPGNSQYYSSAPTKLWRFILSPCFPSLHSSLEDYSTYLKRRVHVLLLPFIKEILV